MNLVFNLHQLKKVEQNVEQIDTADTFMICVA